MRCFMCFSSDSKLQMIQGDLDNKTFKRITIILPDFIFYLWFGQLELESSPGQNVLTLQKAPLWRTLHEHLRVPVLWRLATAYMVKELFAEICLQAECHTQQRVKSTIPKSQDPVIVCSTCLEQVSSFFTIKKAGLQNCSRLKQFNAMLKGTKNFKYDELSIKINNGEVSRELNHIEIKVEPNNEDLYLSEDTDPTHVMTRDKECDFYSQQLVNVKSSLNHSQDEGSSSSSNNNACVGKLTKKDSNLWSTDSRYEDQSKTQCESQKKRFKCTDCRKAFTCPSNLEIHSRVHTGDKPYKCTTCQKTFTRLSNLNTHKLTHIGEKPHECDVCHKTFYHISNLISHKRIHDNVRPFQCAVCSKAFTTSTHLTAHMLTHTGEKPHQCHLCEYKCTRPADLKIHIRRHTGEKPYSCKHCEKSFTSTSELKVHKRRHHSNED